MTTTACDDQFGPDYAGRDELLTELAMEIKPWQFKGIEGYFCREYKGSRFQLWEYVLRRKELINCPPDSDAPEWAEWKAQEKCGKWCWYKDEPVLKKSMWDIPAIASKYQTATHGKIPAGHDWRTTLTRINRDDNTSTPEEEEEFERIQARQDAGKPHEADARMLDAQLADAIQFGKISPNANSIINAAAHHMQERAATYDKPEGERSMGATVEAFKATTGIDLTEEQGWHFMALLKLVRSQQGDYRADSYEDGAAYVALAGEAAAKRRAK